MMAITSCEAGNLLSEIQALTAIELLSVWEQGRTLSATERASALLRAASPNSSVDMWSQRSVGQRDAALLTLREQTFGSRLAGQTTCPACSEPVEVCFQADDIRCLSSSETKVDLSLTMGDYEVQFRPPNGEDLAAIADEVSDQGAVAILLRRCLLDVQHRGEPAIVEQLPTEVTDAVVERMSWADPLADLQLAVRCPACQHGWKAAFDIASYFWREIDVWSRRTLHEVHCLASAYGWREIDILSMSAWRRKFYLEAVGS